MEQIKGIIGFIFYFCIVKMFILSLLTIALLGIIFILFLAVFLTAFFNYRTIKKTIRYDQQRIEEGNSVLLKDSFLFKALYYADKDFSLSESNIEDPLNLFSILAFTKTIFTLTQVCLLFTLLLVVIIFFKEFSGSQSGEEKLTLASFSIIGFPLFACFIISFMMIVYTKSIYAKLYKNEAQLHIQQNKDRLNNLHKRILDSIPKIANDPNFYSWLNSDITTDTLHKNLIENSNPSRDALIKRLTALSIRDYFMKEVPDYNNSPVKNLFTSDVNKRISNPGDYIRIDCSQTIQHYAYKHDALLRSVTNYTNGNEILSTVSTTLGDINREIAQFRLKSEPMVVLIENYFRVSALYFFFMFIIITAVIIGWYSLGCKLGIAINFIKYWILRFWALIRQYILRKSDQEVKEYKDSIDTAYLNEVKGKICIPSTKISAQDIKQVVSIDTQQGTPQKKGFFGNVFNSVTNIMTKKKPQ